MPAIRIPGEETRDSMRLITKAAEVLSQQYDGRPVKMMFVAIRGVLGRRRPRSRRGGDRPVPDQEAGDDVQKT